MLLFFFIHSVIHCGSYCESLERIGEQLRCTVLPRRTMDFSLWGRFPGAEGNATCDVERYFMATANQSSERGLIQNGTKSRLSME